MTDTEAHRYVQMCTDIYICIYVYILCTLPHKNERWWRWVFQADGKQESLVCADEWRHFALVLWFSKYGPRPSPGVLQGQHHPQVCGGLHWRYNGSGGCLRKKQGSGIWWSPYAPPPHIHGLKKGPKNVLEEAGKNINFIKYRPLSTHLFNVPCDRMGSTHKALLLQAKVWQLSGRKSTCVTELRAELATLLPGTPFLLERWQTEKPWLFRLGYL